MTVNILVFFNVEIEKWETERRRKRKRTEPLLKWIIFTRKSGFLEGFLMFNPRCWTHLLYGDLCGLIPTFASFPSEVGAQQHTWKPRNCEHTRIKVLARVGGVFLLRGPGWTRVKTGGGRINSVCPWCRRSSHRCSASSPASLRSDEVPM